MVIGRSWYKIVSKEGTALDTWGGKIGENAASLQPDDGNNTFRLWHFANLGNGWYKIVSK